MSKAHILPSQRIKRLVFVILVFTLYPLLSGCTFTKQINADESQVSFPKQREAQLAMLQHWKVKGKIAFITPSKKESAGLSWHVNEISQSQQLNLNSYLGINVLDLNSQAGKHTIKVDGKTYHGTNLPQLIYDLTGLTLPIHALNYWLKGIAYKSNDEILLNGKTHLPFQLTSLYQGRLWQIKYEKYKPFTTMQLPTKISIRQDDLLIKFSINNWQVLPN
jgi:outer membrane lipoprotein LolB